MHIRRTLLYMPGDDLHKIQKGISLGVNCICMDLEDGVAANQKDKARETIVTSLENLDFNGSERVVRINPVGSGLEDDDIHAILPAHPDAILIPKVGDADQVHRVCALISQAERNHEWEPGKIAVLVLIETGLGVVNLKEIVQADTRVEALIFGAEDLAGNIGAERTPEGQEIFYARSAVVTHAAAYGLQALDMVYMDLKDLSGLEVEARQAARMGYTGKQAIHPAQVDLIQQTFTPSDEAIAQAQRVVSAAEEHQQEGVGAFAMDGKMVDAPVVRAAERVLERARAAKKIE